MYGVSARNSPAQVSMRLNTGRTPSFCRASRTAVSVEPVSFASRASEKPCAFSRRNVAASFGRPSAAIRFSSATSAWIWRRNHGSYEQAAWISSQVRPWRKAWAITRSRSGVGLASARSTAACPISGSSALSMAVSSRPVSPVSSPRRAFCRLSAKVRPMAITSPTDFIWVVR
jgi:hypothetical protein